MNQTMVQMNKTESWFSEKINKIDKPLARLIKKKKREESNQQNQKRKRRGYNRQCRNMEDLRDCYEQLYGKKMDNMEEMDRFL